jgi:hypothetical protein
MNKTERSKRTVEKIDAFFIVERFLLNEEFCA